MEIFILLILTFLIRGSIIILLERLEIGGLFSILFAFINILFAFILFALMRFVHGVYLRIIIEFLVLTIMSITEYFIYKDDGLPRSEIIGSLMVVVLINIFYVIIAFVLLIIVTVLNWFQVI